MLSLALKECLSNSSVARKLSSAPAIKSKYKYIMIYFHQLEKRNTALNLFQLRHNNTLTLSLSRNKSPAHIPKRVPLIICQQQKVENIFPPSLKVPLPILKREKSREYFNTKAPQ